MKRSTAKAVSAEHAALAARLRRLVVAQFRAYGEEVKPKSGVVSSTVMLLLAEEFKLSAAAACRIAGVSQSKKPSAERCKYGAMTTNGAGSLPAVYAAVQRKIRKGEKQ